MSQPAIVTDSVRAFLDNDDSPDIRNPIHSTSVAQEYGFRGALVGGVTVWSWCTPAILEALGEAWLDRGWAAFRFRRPTYPGDEMGIHIGPPGPPGPTHTADTAAPAIDAAAAEEGLPLRMSNQDGEDCVVGRVGIGDAPWLGALVRPATPLVPGGVDDPSLLTMESGPVGRDWQAMTDAMTPAAAAAYLDESHAHRAPHPLFTGSTPRLHPGWLASRCESIMRHNHIVPSSMHTQSRVQLLAPAPATGPIHSGARVLRVLDMKGHHAVVFDTLVTDAAGRELALIEHTTIFRIARPGQRQ